MQLNLAEHLICELDKALRILMPISKRNSNRESPDQAVPENYQLTAQQKRHVAGLMRVNHAGEVCAQALYQGQALTAQLPEVRAQMAQASEEEIDHLAWCEIRLQALGSKPSLLNPLWYLGSFIIGSMAGLAGDRWSLGFVAETERQVSQHLMKHLEKLPSEDKKTQIILEKMQEEEAAHADVAIAAGAAQLPWFIKKLMEKTSKLMTSCSYYF